VTALIKKTALSHPTEWYRAFLAKIFRILFLSKFLKTEKLVNLMVKLAGTELNVWYYAFFAWRKKPFIPEGSTAFSYHKESGFITVLIIMGIMSPIEIIGAHYIISLWSPVVAVIYSFLTIVTILWILGMVRAIVLRPITVDNEGVTLNYSFSLAERISFSAIESITAKDLNLPRKEFKDCSMMGATKTWVVFKEPLEIATAFGGKRKYRAVAVTPDNASAFRSLVVKGINHGSFGFASG